jgi:anti-sigma factor RsiW
MRNEWHEQIQRYVDGKSSDEEAASLQQALAEDAELRRTYLDYVNLDVALGDASEKWLLAERKDDRAANSPKATFEKSAGSWRWIAAAAACLALVLFVMLSNRRRAPEPARPDFAATFASTQHAIARLSLEPAPSLTWSTSPTASLLASSPAPQ